MVISQLKVETELQALRRITKPLAKGTLHKQRKGNLFVYWLEAAVINFINVCAVHVSCKTALDLDAGMT